jgi:anti-sigma factor RsiW
MTDCPNAEVRDLLPELAAGTLAPEARAAVDSHLAGCAECRAELALLESIRRAFARPVAVNVGRIAAAIPSAAELSAMNGASHGASGRARGGIRVARWQVAAAVSLFAVGAASIWTLGQLGPNVAQPIDSSGAGVIAADQRAVTLGHRLGELSEQDLEALLGALDGIDALPALDPAPIIAPLGGGEGS